MSTKDNDVSNEKAGSADAAGATKPSNGEQSHVRVTRVTSRRRPVVIALLLLAVSAVALALLFGRGSSTQEGRPVPAPTFETVPQPSSGSSTSPRPGEIVITLSSDQLATAQIKTEPATAQAGGVEPAAGGIRTTGIVQANAYKEVPVMPIAGGIVRQVNAELGSRVGRGQTLAIIFSDELSEAQSNYLKMLAEVEQHQQRYRRTVELVELGAVSREELEQATANFKTAQANLASTKQQLVLLGMTPQQVDALRGPGQVSSLIPVPAPSSGTVISRTVNPGEVVMTGKEMFRVADLSTVWVIGQVYESDLAAVRVGMPAVITSAAYPGRTFTGRVSYIDPQVNPQTRTAQVRVEVANPGQILKLEMFVDVGFGGGAAQGTSGQSVVSVPRAAVQAIGARQVVFVATDQPGVFVQRDVATGPEANGLMPIYSGVSAGELVVTEGSFMLRAESLKRNPSQPMSSDALPQPVTPQAREQRSVQTGQARQMGESSQQSEPSLQTARVVLTKDGYKPASVRLRQGVPARITFIRQVEVTCGTEVLFPEYDIRRELPLNEAVTVEFTPSKRGEFTFACGMGMLRGKLVVK